MKISNVSINVFNHGRNLGLRVDQACSVLAGAFLLSACQQPGASLPSYSAQTPPPQQTDSIKPLPVLSEKVEGEKVGNGPIRVALLVPKTATGGAGLIGNQMANAARIAVRDFGAGRLQLVIKDTKGQGAQAAIAADQARQEGASIVLGPLFSANVSNAAAVTRPANLPMVAFSSDMARAGKDIYLLSFAPGDDVRRTLNYSISLGANRVVALLPDNAYGTIAEREMRRTVDTAGGQVVSVKRYARNAEAMILAARSVAMAVSNANAIYIPDGGKVPALMLNTLKEAGVDLTGKQILGSGQWESINLNNSQLNGAVFAGPDKRNFNGFASRYSATYGKAPAVNAAIAYDAVSLAAELIRRNPQAPFTPSAIQSRGGFNGTAGVFRFEANGRVQRGLVVNQVESGKVIVVSPAPTGFGYSG